MSRIHSAIFALGLTCSSLYAVSSFHFETCPPHSYRSPLNNVLTVKVGFKCFDDKEKVEKQLYSLSNLAPHSGTFHALINLHTSTSWILMHNAEFNLGPGIPHVPADRLIDRYSFRQIAILPECYMSQLVGKGVQLDSRILRHEHDVRFNVKFDERAYKQSIEINPYMSFCAIVGQTSQIDIVGNISQMELLQFNAVLGFGNSNDNPLFIGLKEANVPQMLAINANNGDEKPQISVGERPAHLPEMNKSITLPVIQEEHRLYWAVNLRIQFQFPLDFGKNLFYVPDDDDFCPLLLNTGKEKKNHGDFAIFDTTNEYITAPSEVRDELQSEQLPSRALMHPDLNNFLFESIELPCAYAESLMPNLFFCFSNEKRGLWVQLEGKFLLRKTKDNGDGSPICTHWIRFDEREDHMWRLGLTFLRKVYVEMHFDPAGDGASASSDDRHETVKIYRKPKM